MKITDNLRITKLKALIAPGLLVEGHPLDKQSAKNIAETREQASDIIHGKSDRLMVIVGPCSIHDPIAAIDYAKKLKSIQKKYAPDLLIIMRVYFEKPRTTVGWKGLINDPGLDNSFDINRGLTLARELLLSINKLGVPTGSEFLDTIIPQYISDLTSWSAIGARTTESQIHRELASGLSMPLGFKNSTNGNVQVAVDAVCAAAQPHHFLGVSKQSVAAIVSTSGNKDCHVILRGGKDGPNYNAESVAKAVSLIKKANLTPRLMVDMSHGNSCKDYKRQSIVAEEICQQLEAGTFDIMGVMIESNLVEGNQKLEKGRTLTYGQSITDSCVNWDKTLEILDRLTEAVQIRRGKMK